MEAPGGLAGAHMNAAIIVSGPGGDPVLHFPSVVELDRRRQPAGKSDRE